MGYVIGILLALIFWAWISYELATWYWERAWRKSNEKMREWRRRGSPGGRRLP